MSDIDIARGDLLPAVVAYLTWPDDGYMPQTLEKNGSTWPVVEMIVTDPQGETRTLTCEIVDAVARKIRYLWNSGDTDIAGDYVFYFKVTFPWLTTGAPPVARFFRCPNNGTKTLSIFS